MTLNFALDASEILKDYKINLEVWSITSFNELYKEAIEQERKKDILGLMKKHMFQKYSMIRFRHLRFQNIRDRMQTRSENWATSEYIVLGTDGFGRSDTRDSLRNFFEIDANHIVLNILKTLNRETDLKEYVRANNLKFAKEAPWKR